MSVQRTSLHAAFHALTADDGPRPPETPPGTCGPVPSSFPLQGVAS
jgi:hypothetical protein